MTSLHTFPVRGRHRAPMRICDRKVYTHLEGSYHLSVLLKVHWQNRPPLRRRNPAETPKRQTGPSSTTWLTYCVGNLTLTTARTSTPMSSSWLTACFRQQSRPSSEAEGRTTSLSGVTIYSASMTNSQKPENNLSSSPRQSTPSSTTKLGLLLTKNRSRKPASHGKKRLAHSTWRKTHRHSGICQRPWMTITACPKSSPFEGRYPDLHGQEGSLLACIQFPRGQPDWYLKGETSRHQNEDQGTTTETVSNARHDI